MEKNINSKLLLYISFFLGKGFKDINIYIFNSNMSGLTQDNPQSNADRAKYMSMVRSAIQQQNEMHTGDINNSVMRFGALFTMREQMDGAVGFGQPMNPYDRSAGQREIHIDINSHKNEPNDDEEPKGGEMEITDSESEKSDKGGMILSDDAVAFHKKRAGRKTKKTIKGGKAPTGADFSGADIVNSDPIKNEGPDVGGRAKLGDRTPNNNAGIGVQSWTEYPNKNLSNEDIKEATATVRDIQNDFLVANQPSTDVIYNGIMKLASGKRQYTERSIGGGLKRKTGGFAFLAPLAMSAAAPLVSRLASKVGDWLGLGKRCGGGKDSKCAGALRKKIEDDLSELGLVKKHGATKSSGGAMAVASPDIDEGKRSPVDAGINLSTQIDGFQDPRTLGMASQAGVGAPLGGKKKRVRKPMTAEQKKAFALRMAAAKLKIRQQK